ncbi:hypothetical protein GCM10017788_40340 [Amycolatopsis acidiphila]|nr:hypothetical protein GCM10017788_40340 [Amycolatopsis acidiphila]
MVRDQRAETHRRAQVTQEPRAVERVEAGDHQRSGITDVMQNCRGDKQILFIGGQEPGTDPGGYPSSRSHVRPPSR